MLASWARMFVVSWQYCQQMSLGIVVQQTIQQNTFGGAEQF